MAQLAGEVIDLLRQVGQTIDTISSVASDPIDPDGLPSVFLEVSQRLPLIRETLKMIERNLLECKVNEEGYRRLLSVLRGCRDNAGSLEHIFQVVLPVSNSDTRHSVYRDTVSSLGKGSRLETLTIWILESFTRLAGIHPDLVTEEQVGRLGDAVLSLSVLPPSVGSDDPVGVNIINTGPGSQTIFLHQSAGKQHNNSGPGNQYIASAIHFRGDPI